MNIPRDQAIIDAYAGGDSYNAVARNTGHGQEYVRQMIRVHAPHLHRTRLEQLAITRLREPTPRGFAPEDLDLAAAGDCLKCGVPMLWKVRTRERRTCGLCVAYAEGIAA